MTETTIRPIRDAISACVVTLRTEPGVAAVTP